jgi:NitT/TauT family transport system substrate-binding protein
MRFIFGFIFRRRLGPAIMAAALSMTSAYAADKVVIYTNWFAEPEHGGVWQAKAAGIFEKYGMMPTCGRAARR